MSKGKYRVVYTLFWEDSKVSEEMTPEDKYFMLYLLTNPSTKQCGIYEISTKKMAFDLGYSIESVKSLLERFESYHKVIKYNKETREMAILNWGKYNLNKGGKPVEDCIKSELKEVTDLELIKLVSKGIAEGRIKALYQAFYDTCDDTCDDTSTIRGQKEKEKEKEKEKNNIRPNFSSFDIESSKRLFDLILENNPNAKKPNLETWANSIRLMRERDKRTEEQIMYVIEWCQKDNFWFKNILSTSKLREQFDRLVLEIKSKSVKVKNESKLITNESKPWEVGTNEFTGIEQNSRGNLQQLPKPNEKYGYKSFL